jgi:DNA-binding SARP family transcriptional activator/tetratricopeptide (TPR) repeat protein
MQRPYLCLLGSSQFYPSSGGETTLRGERRDQLLAYLACQLGWVGREQLAELFWGDKGAAGARANLRFAVLQLRRTGFEGFEATVAALRWNIATDTRDFEDAVAAQQWQAALDLWRGTPLPNYEFGAPPGFANWLRFQRSRLHTLWLDAAAARLQQLASDPEACLTIARSVLAHDPLNESAIEALLRAELALGRRADAQRHWQAYTKGLANHHGLEPSAELREFAARLMQTQGSVRRSPAPVGCIGRRSEQAQVLHLLDQPNCRLLTVTGPGGVGKSTLARALMAALHDRYADEVHWIALEELTSIDEIAPRLAACVGVKLSDENPLMQITDHLSTRPCMLVFDNAEHLSDFASFAETILQRCPQVRLLVTSRARSAAPGEWLLPLDGLPVPDLDERDVNVLRAFDSVLLFEARALAVAPAFSLEKHASDVVQLIHAVEGLPLALELCASLTRLLPAAEVLSELQSSPAVFDAQHINERERSLRSSFEHSWRMLSPVEREVLSCLGIFAGGFSRSAAQNVAGAGLPILASLVDKSLLRASGDGRFSMHPVIRQYAMERLSDRDEVAVKHADHYAQLLSRVHAGGDPRARLDEVALEWANCAAAWYTSLAAGLMTNIEASIRTLGPFADQRGYFVQVEVLAEAARQRIRPTDGPARRAHAMTLWLLCNLKIRHGRLEEAHGLALAALRGFIALRDRREIASSLSTLGVCLDLLGDHQGARDCYERGLRRAQRDGSEAEAARLETNLAIAEDSLGHHGRALLQYQSALARREPRDPSRVALLNNIGEVLLKLGKPMESVRQFEEALECCRELKVEQQEPLVMGSLARAYLRLALLEQADKIASQAIELARQKGSLQAEIGGLVTLAEVASARCDYPVALRHLAFASQQARHTGYAYGQCSALLQYAAVLMALGERVRAAVIWQVLVADHKVEAYERSRAEEGIAQLGLSDAEIAQAQAGSATQTVDTAITELVEKAQWAAAQVVQSSKPGLSPRSSPV